MTHHLHDRPAAVRGPPSRILDDDVGNQLRQEPTKSLQRARPDSGNYASKDSRGVELTLRIVIKFRHSSADGRSVAPERRSNCAAQHPASRGRLGILRTRKLTAGQKNLIPQCLHVAFPLVNLPYDLRAVHRPWRRHWRSLRRWERWTHRDPRATPWHAT